MWLMFNKAMTIVGIATAQNRLNTTIKIMFNQDGIKI